MPWLHLNIHALSRMASKECVSSSVAAQAVNQIIRLECEADQEALLQVLEDYFCPPSHEGDGSEDEDCQPDSRGIPSLPT